MNLGVDASRSRDVPLYCDGGIHASPRFTIEIRNLAPVGTDGPVRVRAIDAGRPEVFRDTVLAPLGPYGRATLSQWTVPLPRDLRYGADIVRQFDIIVDPDHRYRDADLRDNTQRVQRILILCRPS